ncbi:MAG: YafY family transcriptional regulator [Defluviitaleaceae bacterium]|nr:YafY family transcriptional regulator [Defluviitaleaceae bacterium]MCL2836729.1 YafY family transcriptional regulator [Defluviitaleaceae bacterium]
MQINRLIEIVYVLLRQKTVTARELAERFGVSQRTIYRDIDVLSLSGIPVYTEKGKGGGISLLPEFVLSKSILNEQEQNAILSALHGLSSIKTPDTALVLQKLSAVFKKNAMNWLEVDFSEWGWSDGGCFNSFKTAIFERRIAEFDYYSSHGELTSRRVEPVQLWFKSKAWYVRGFCLMRQDMRLFKFTRVRNLKLTEERFPERDLTAIPRKNALPAEQPPWVCLKLKIAGEMAYRVYDDFNDEGIEKLPDGSFLVTDTWLEEEWVYGLLLSYGEAIEVLAPEHIRDLIREKSLKIAEKHSAFRKIL